MIEKDAVAPAMDANVARMMLMFSQLSEEKQEFLLKQAEMYLEAESPKGKSCRAGIRLVKCSKVTMV